MKFKKIIALFLSSSMMLSTPQITYTAPSFGLGSGSNGVVMSGSWLPEVDGFDVSVDNELQALRISLIKVGSSDSTPDGMPYIDDKIVQNPIQVYNENNNRVRSAKEDYSLRFIVNEDTKSRTASRRELTGWSRSNTDLTKAPMVYGCHWDTNSNAWVADSGDNFIKTRELNNYTFDDPAIPDFCGSLKSSYQESSKATSLGHPEWASMSNQEYFLSYTRSAFYVDKAGKVVPEFALKTIAKMLGKYNDPYCDEVEQFYNDHILTGELVFLVEPMMFLKNTPQSYTEEVFGPVDEVPYIGLTCGEIGFLDDSYSSVNYGYTDLGNHNRESSSDGNPNNYNYLTAPKSSSAKACMDLYKSTTLESNELKLGLYSPLGAVSAGGLKDQTKANINLGTNSNLTEITNTENNYGVLFGNGTTNEEHIGAAFSTCVYKQVYNDAANGSGTTIGYTDPYAIMNVGGLMVVRPIYSTIDFKADSLVPSSDPQATTPATPIRTLKTQTKGECPVYPRDVIYQDENGNNFVNIKAISKLNFDDNATSWLDKVTQNKASLLQSTSEDVKMVDNTFDLSQPIYIPARTKTLVHLHYANEQGQGGETIQIDNNNDDSKLYIENNHLFGYFQNNDTASKAVDILSSSANHGKPTQDNKDLHGEIPVGHNIPVSEMSNIPVIQDIGDEGYVKVYLPKNIDITQKYLQVTLDVNMGKYSDGSFSRPQKTNEGNKYAVLTVPNGEPEAICDCVEENFDNNSLTILIKLQQSLDLSADSITRGSSPIITKDPIKVSQCNISTTATANEGAIKSYPTSTVTQTLYYYFSNTNTNEFQNVYNTATDNTDWSNPNVLSELVTKYDTGLPTVNGKKITQTTHIKPTSGIDPMDINWNECAISPEVDPNQTIYLHLALVVNPDNNIPNEETYKNNIVFKTYPYDIPDDPLPPPSSPALSCYVPTGSSTGLPLRILNNSTPTNYITGILNSKVLEANNDPNKVEGSLDSHYGAKIRVNDVPNTKPTGFRPDPQYEEIDSIVVGRCNGENEQEEPEDTPEWVFYDEDDLIFHEIAFKYLSYDAVKRRYYVATQILPYTKRVIEHTPCDCEDGCSSPTVTYHYYRLCDTQTVDYTLIFDDLYSADSNVSSAYSLQSLLNQESERGKYYYFAEAGSPVGLTMRTRLISDFPDFSNFSDTGEKSTGAGVPLGGIVQLADSKGLFNSNNNIKATLELTGFEYVKHILNDYDNTTGPSRRAGAVDKSNDYYSNILLAPSGFTNDFIANPTTLDTSPELDRDTDALYGANLNGTNPNGTWQYTTYPLENTFTTDYISTRYYRFDISEQPIVLGGGNSGTPKNVGKQRGVVTDKDYSDGIKVNKNGIGQINNDYIKSKRLYKNGIESSANSVADAIDRYSYRYCSQRLKPIVWTQEIYLPTGLDFYNYTTYAGTSLENSNTSLLGLCGDYNILINGTVADNYTMN